MKLTRENGEDILEYKLRICDNKETLGLTWKEVARVINKETGKDFGESKYRKWYTSFNEGREYAIENTSTNEEIDKLIKQETIAKLERSKLTTRRNEINRWLRERGREELIQDDIKEAIQNLKKMKIPKVITEKNNEKVVTVDLADIHFGRSGVIHGLQNEILAEYSPEIFYRRMEELLAYTEEILIKENTREVVVFNLGDSIDGLLRLTQLQTLSLGVIEQVMQLAEYLSEWLNELSQIANVNYYSVLGNHAEMRIAGIKSGEMKKENLELIITWFIQERLRNNPNVTVHDAQFIQIVKIFNTNICITHGQNEKNLENSIKDYAMIYGQPIHILKTGHLHHLNNKSIGMSHGKNIEYIQSPSICGIDEYSMKLKKTAQAGSLITVFTPKGKYCTYEITF